MNRSYRKGVLDEHRRQEPEPGTVLVARYKKRDHRCEVVKGEEGKVLYRLKGGQEFTSPSAAGTAVMGGVACNGWRFWSVEGTAPARKATTTPTAPKKAATKAKGGRKAKAARKAKPKAKARKPATNGAAPSKTIGCGTCGQEFPNAAEATDHMQKEHNTPAAVGSGGR